jgi:hypothetical protein
MPDTTITREQHWDRLIRAVRRTYGITGHHDPGGAEWHTPDGTKLCRTSEMFGSGEQDCMTTINAIIDMELEPVHINRSR